ncbi:MAG TPA: rhomboid family intramembrane serine protease [Anaerolineales bacterium]|nr:rhomboid family intramembrane serine protease [Anaerolineales bacterium]
MLPIGDDDSARRTTPVVTYALIAINVLFFLVELSAGDAFIERWSVVPRRLLANPVADFITIFTAMFMHGGWMHLLGNMLYLWIFGDNVEDRLGHFRYLVFYILCGIAATFAQVLVDPNSNIPNLGASGAIAGVLGAYLLMFPRGSVRVMMGRGIIPMPALIVIGFWALLQFLSGFGAIASTEQTGGGGVAYMAHVGGFVAGLVLAVLMGGTRQEPRLRAY